MCCQHLADRDTKYTPSHRKPPFDRGYLLKVTDTLVNCSGTDAVWVQVSFISAAQRWLT